MTPATPPPDTGTGSVSTSTSDTSPAPAPAPAPATSDNALPSERHRHRHHRDEEQSQQNKGSGGGGGGGGGNSDDGGGQQERSAPSFQPREEEEEDETDDDDDDDDDDGDSDSGVGLEIGEDISMPLLSSHYIGPAIRTSGVVITPYSCGVLSCNAKRPANPKIGAEAAVIQSVNRLAQMSQREKQRKCAEQLVVRARAGDQNAMAIISLSRQNADKGNPIAKAAVAVMQQYIADHPVTVDNFGNEKIDKPKVTPDTRGAVALANGMPLNRSRISPIFGCFGAEDNQVFLQGVLKWQRDHDKAHEQLATRLNEMQKQILRLGRTLGKARALQVVRLPHTPVKGYDSSVAWELGE